MESQDQIMKISMPFTHQGGISALKCVDKERYVVGFYDGFVFVSWKG